MRRLLILTAMIVVSMNVANAQEVSTYMQGDARDAQAITADSTDESVVSYLKTFGEEVNKITPDGVDVAQIAQKLNLANKCENFVQADGSLSQWGEVVDNELTPQKYSAIFEGPTDLKALCPAYSKMDNDDKKSVWILILENMANFESSCNPRTVLAQRSKTNKGGAPNGTAAGLLSLDQGHEGIYDEAACRNGDSSDPTRTLICALSMLNLQVSKGKLLFDPASYWAVLRTNQPRNRNHPNIPNAADQIILAIKAYTPCANPGAKSAAAAIASFTTPSHSSSSSSSSSASHSTNSSASSSSSSHPTAHTPTTATTHTNSGTTGKGTTAPSKNTVAPPAANNSANNHGAPASPNARGNSGTSPSAPATTTTPATPPGPPANVDPQVVSIWKQLTGRGSSHSVTGTQH